MFSILNLIKSQDDEEKRAKEYRELIRKEARLGGELFGPIPEGVRREFFALDEHTWVWHEEWVDKAGKRQAITTRYDVRPNGVLKAQDGQPYRYVSLEEGRRLYKAVKMYDKIVQSTLYS
ncbi:MAG TPA: hypothetical protein VFM05_11010 [Candidatus Saccharimonadales bacterium]|nr:hypothetical protein [Candidatus Saccharimonadales bacterium]